MSRVAVITGIVFMIYKFFLSYKLIYLFIFTCEIGANKGIGYGIAKSLAKVGGLEVILTARDPKLGLEAVAKLKKYLSDNKLFTLVTNVKYF